MVVDFSKTYLYKLHTLTNALDKLFDRALLKFAGCTLSQFTLLLAIQQHQAASQHAVASFLEITPAAISRQVEIAVAQGYITAEVPENNRRTRTLTLTSKGTALIKSGLVVLEEHVFQIFDAEDAHTNLMSHIEMLGLNVKEALCEINSKPGNQDK